MRRVAGAGSSPRGSFWLAHPRCLGEDVEGKGRVDWSVAVMQALKDGRDVAGLTLDVHRVH